MAATIEIDIRKTEMIVIMMTDTTIAVIITVTVALNEIMTMVGITIATMTAIMIATTIGMTFSMMIAVMIGMMVDMTEMATKNTPANKLLLPTLKIRTTIEEERKNLAMTATTAGIILTKHLVTKMATGMMNPTMTTRVVVIATMINGMTAMVDLMVFNLS